LQVGTVRGLLHEKTARMSVYVMPPGQAADHMQVLDVTTHGNQYRPLSPMLLGPVPLYGGYWSRTMENAWQYAKMYPGYEDPGVYWPWALAGWDNPRGIRYPMRKGARPLYSLWAGDQLDYVSARKRIYAPLYAQAVRFCQLNLFLALRSLARQADIGIRDFDAYDHRALGYSWDDVINDPDRKMGHGFVLAMMIEGVL
jgi:hypothetical protein